MKTRWISGALGAIALLAGGAAAAQDMPKIALGMSGWTGFAPLTLAAEAGLFKKHGVDVEIKFIPRRNVISLSPPAQRRPSPPRSIPSLHGPRRACR